MVKDKTLEQFLRENLERGNIDFALRARMEATGEIAIYTYPEHVNGVTLDFTVKDNVLTPVEFATLEPVETERASTV